MTEVQHTENTSSVDMTEPVAGSTTDNINGELNSDEELRSLPAAHFKTQGPQLLDKYIRLAIIVLLLLWGSVVLLKTVEVLKNGRTTSPKNGGRNNDSSTYRLPPSLLTEDGFLKVSFNNTRNGTFKPNFQTLQWFQPQNIGGESANYDAAGVLDKGLYFTTMNDTAMIKSVIDKNFTRVLFEGKTFSFEEHNLTIDSIVASPRLDKLILKTNSQKNWRHSTFASYFLYSLSDGGIHHIGDNISLTQWSPNSLDIAYVQDNNVYVYSSETFNTTSKVTDSGSSTIFNGRPDWVYEEEIYESDRTLWWSSNGKYLAFLKIDESDVMEYTIPYFVQHDLDDDHDHDDNDDVYPEMRTIKYPKSGTPNPHVELMVYDMINNSCYEAHVNKFHSFESVLLTEVTWVGREDLILKMTDRSSDTLIMLQLNLISKETTLIRSVSSHGSWWEITHKTMFVPRDIDRGRSENGYIDLVPVEGYNHLVYYPSINSREPIILTSGQWEVVNGPLTFDSETNRVYFISTQRSSMERHVYYVTLDKPNEIIDVSDTSKPGVYDVSFSSSNKYAMLTYRGPDVPYQKVISLDGTDGTVHGNKIGKTLYYLEENKELKQRLTHYKVPNKTMTPLKIGTDDDGEDIIVNCMEIVPNNFNPQLKNYYPLFFYTYGGPNSQQVLKTFSVTFNEVVASQLNAIVVVVDGRGTGFKGSNFRSMVRGNLGDYEAQDQINAAALFSARSYVDSEKVSLFGWSYGGYLTLKTLERDAGKHFKYGMAVAPVTDWKLYDSVYTERYMSTPQENVEGYEKSRVHNVTAISGVKRFLLMHGTGDDNVHFQHSMKFLDKLNLNGIENYDVHVFPDSDHSISYHNANNIVYDKLFSWTRNAFTGKLDEM